MPAAMATTNLRRLPIAKKTKMPPCGAFERHAERPCISAAGHGAAEHAGGDDAQRVGRGERDRAFGDEGGSQQPGGLAVFLFRLG